MDEHTEEARRAAARLGRWIDARVEADPVAVVLGASCNGLSFVRSLGRRGIPTLLVDSRRTLGTYTRFGKVVRLPPPEAATDAWVVFLELVGERLAAPGVLFATSDEHTLLMARHEERLRQHFRFLIPEAETLARVVDKRAQYELARSMGIPIPDVRFPESVEQATLLAAEMSYPCILKPCHGHSARAKLGGLKVVVVHSSDELVAQYERLFALGVPLMVQEIVPGEDRALFGYLGFWDREGRERAWVTKQKLRQHPPGFGDGSLQVTVDAPEVADSSRTLLRALRYRGFVGVEFKHDERDGSYRLIEINARTVSGNELAIRAGVDFPWLGYRYLTGAELGSGAVTRGRKGVKYVNEEWDVRAFLALRRTRGITLTRWLGSLRGARAKAIWAWDDPLPLTVWFGRLARLPLGAILSLIR